MAGRRPRSATQLTPSSPTPPLDGLDLAALTPALAELGADGWLLFDFHHINPVMTRLLGRDAVALGTRRLFVLLPVRGRPVAVAHRVEQHALAGFPAEVARGAEVREAALQRRVLDAIDRAGLVTDEPPIVAFQENSALPHYEPREGADRRLQAGQVLLLDLWAGPARQSVFADQTWMAFAGRSPDAEVRRVWEAVRGARDAVIDTLRDRWRSGGGKRGPGGVSGAELDDVARGVIREAGYAEYFVHRTGHSIDRELHGSGPHLDNFETADTRGLIPGVGFSVEPGVYFPGRFGMRSEINVFLAETGPEVTPPAPQKDLLLV